MRRNRDFGNNRQASPGGPLMTNHLRDLDIELELLKRKRDIIQQEQDIINRYSSKRQYDYGLSSNTYNLQESSNQQFNTNNYSARYDGPSGSGNFTRPQAPKRQTPHQYWQPPSNTKNFTPIQKINPWQTPMPKQNSGFSNQNQKKFQNPQPRNNPTHIRPLMSIRPSIGQKIQKNHPAQKNLPTQRKDFKPTKVTKPKPHQPPNKLATYSHDQAKKLVSQAIDSTDRKAEGDQILRADKTPTIQMKGRLELALGMIIKEIKTEHCSDSDDLEYMYSPFIQRLLKHTIRTRIRNVMIDQVVGNINDIVANYRKKYPKETDTELVQVAKDAQSLSSKTVGVAQLIESDDPEDFYKKNMVKALSTKLDEMFSSLEKLYMNKSKNVDELIDQMPEPKRGDEKEKKQNTSNNNPDASRGKINFENIIGDEGNVLEAINDKLAKVKYYTNVMDELIEFRLPKILPKFKDMLLSIMLTDREFLGVKAMITSQIKKKLIKLSGNEELDESALDLFNDHKSKKFAKKMMPKAKPIPTKPTPVTKSAPSTSDIEMSVTNKTPTKESSDNTLSTTEPAVDQSNGTVTTEKSSESEKSVVPPPKVSPAKATEPTISATPTKMTTEKNIPATPKTPAATELHFVKLISRPALPARAVIYDFLNQFNATSIKKHKSISNLLVIGFKNIEDYNKILTVNETVVGNATIAIKASEQMSKPNPATPSHTEIKENEPKSADQSLADLSIGTDLDNQITDLLTSIRKADESGNTEDENAIMKENNAKSDGTTTADNKINNSNVNKANGDGDGFSNQDNVENDNSNSKTDENECKELETICEANDVIKKELTDPNGGDNEKKNEFDANKELTKADADKLKENLKDSGRATPTRTSSRLANTTPSTIRTRRASRLAQNN